MRERERERANERERKSENESERERERERDNFLLFLLANSRRKKKEKKLEDAQTRYYNIFVGKCATIGMRQWKYGGKSGRKDDPEIIRYRITEIDDYY